MKVVIVGGVAGGATAAARLRRNNEKAEIVLFEKGEFISFANCGLPYYIGGVIADEEALLLQTPERFYARYRVDVRTNTEVTAVHPAEKAVSAINHATGEEYREPYDKLILAPGASPILPPIPGADGANVFTLRSVPDTMAIDRCLRENSPKTAAVVGGGFIGLEMAENLARRGLAVSIIEAKPHVAAQLDADMAHAVHNCLRRNGVSLYLNRTAAAIGTDGVTLSDGQTVPAELVLLSVGVRPQTAFLAGSGIDLSERGEIGTDDQMRTSVPDVFAVGDAAAVTNLVTGNQQSVPLASPANRQARIAADVICGRECYYSGAQGTSVCRVFDLTVAATGESEESLARIHKRCKTSYTYTASHAGYYPGAEMMCIKLLFDKHGLLLGAQATGAEGVDKRMDVLAGAIRSGFTVYDLQDLELSYAPPFGSAKDPVNIAGCVAGNLLDGAMVPAYEADLARLGSGDLLLDVRTPGEYAAGHIEGAVNLPLDELREHLDELDKNKRIVLYCQIGLRGYVAQRILTQHGFAARNLCGGYRLYAEKLADEAAQAAEQA